MRTTDREPARCSPKPWRFSVAEAVARWPLDVPLIALASASTRRHDPAPYPRSRWSVLCSRGRHRAVIPTDPATFAPPMPADGWTVRNTSPGVPFTSGWVGWLGYGLGHGIEPKSRATTRRLEPRAGERAGTGEWFECPGAFVHDAATGQWWATGDTSSLPDIGGPGEAERPGWCATALRSCMGRDAYTRAVARTIEYIRAGDIFQANIAHEMTSEFEGSARGLFMSLLTRAAPWFGALIESDAGTIVSASPELFLEADFASGAVTTRPIKGTRPPARAEELRHSEKDAAELVMIVDLMRNDLGRVCRYGSVRVPEPRRLEHHAGVAHTVATVCGTLRQGVTPGDVIRATFPPGSVTGAPKVRAMQVIDELETFDRGAYCGAIGMISACGRGTWSVAIRTATISGGWARYPVGAGIVADSDPEAEWLETLHKARAFARVLEARDAGARRVTIR